VQRSGTRGTYCSALESAFGVVMSAGVELVAAFQKDRNVALRCLGVIYGFSDDIDIRIYEIRIPGILTAKRDENLDDEKRYGAGTRRVCSIALGTPQGGGANPHPHCLMPDPGVRTESCLTPGLRRDFWRRAE
jgi:hypothetical protein